MTRIQAQDWSDITYLSRGTAVQRNAYWILASYGLLEKLKRFRPVVVGTIPIAIDIQGSDLDIACEVEDFAQFEHTVREAFGSCEKFEYHRKSSDSRRAERAVVRFWCDDFPVEIYGERTPVERQNGFVHMVVEARLLQLFGESAKNAVIAKKRAGLKTEPAFAEYFGLEGDPYETLLELAKEPDERLLRILTVK